MSKKREELIVTLRYAAHMLGSLKSEAKAEAARINGLKGGRPKKKITIDTKSDNVNVVDTGNVDNALKRVDCADHDTLS